MSLCVLELLHPDGIARNTYVVGSNCPPRLAPTRPPELGSPADLLILAPSAGECRRSGWLSGAVNAVEHQLAADGIAYVLAPVRWRWEIQKRLRARGLALDGSVAHLPSVAASRYLVPLRAPDAQYALSALMPNAAWKRNFGLLGLRIRGAEALVSRVWPSAGFVARRSQGRPPMEWLSRIDAHAGPSSTAIISVSWRDERDSAVVHRVSGRTPSAVAKVSLRQSNPRQQADEAAALATLAPTAAAAGARVPRVVATGRLADHQIILETAVPGRSLANVLMAEPGRLAAALRRVANWLERWNLLTRVARGEDSRVHLQHLILEPAARLAPRLHRGEAYRAWLQARCARIHGPVPLVAAHHDLTTWNILEDEYGRLGVVDWEAAQACALPLVDFFYVMSDAVTMSRGGPQRFERVRALQACLAPDSAEAAIVRPLLSRAGHALGASTELVQLCLHACFIHHALNEPTTVQAATARPFTDIAQWLATNREDVASWLSR